MLRHNITDITYLFRNCLVGKKEKFHIFLIFFPPFCFPVGSFVWSHLTNILRSEDPSKQHLIESIPDDIISRDFDAEFLKYSSFSDHTTASGEKRLKG